MKSWKFAVTALLIVLLWWFNHYYLKITPEEIRSWMLSFGALAPIIYIIVYTLRPLILFPATVLCLAGGLAFGPYWGTLYTMIGFTGDAVLAYVLGGYLGQRAIQKSEGRILTWKERLIRRPFTTIATLRLIPIVPFDLVSYAAGWMKLRFTPYLTATLLGTLPVTVTYSFLGSSLADGWSYTLLLGLVLVLIFVIVPVVVLKIRSPH